MGEPRVVEEFAALGLDTDELQALFNVLTSEDGQAHYNAFVAAALAMSSRALRVLDGAKAQQTQLKIAADVRLILEHLNPQAERSVRLSQRRSRNVALEKDQSM